MRRPGFTAALALAGSEVIGFATAWTTVAPFPNDRCYPQAAAGLGVDRTVDWLCGAREIDELAVRSSARGTGLAGELLDAVTEDAPEGRSWLLTSVASTRAMAFYRGQGWTQATHPSPPTARASSSSSVPVTPPGPWPPNPCKHPESYRAHQTDSRNRARSRPPRRRPQALPRPLEPLRTPQLLRPKPAHNRQLFTKRR
ncbi:hypothetical protein GCM10020256_16950 [Streptomyces thermocoprophilus]